MKKFSLGKLFDDRRFALVFSVVAAILAWIVVAMTTGPTTSEYISGVPIRMDLQTESLQLVNLAVVGTVDTTVTVMVAGNRSTVGNLTAEDIVITARTSGITEPGTYPLPLFAYGQTTDYTIKSITPSTIDVRLDQVAQQTFEIGSDVRGLNTPGDYMTGSISVSPTGVTVSGPASELAKVSQAMVVLDLTEPLTNNLSVDVPIVLRDASGNELDPEEHHLSLSIKDTTLFIPVLLTKELNLKVAFTNLPQGFPEDKLRSYMNMSEETILVAGPVNLMENITDMMLGTINLRDLADNNNLFPFSVQMPSDQHININQVANVQVSFDSDNWDSVVLSGIDNIIAFNEPAGYRVEILQTTMSPIEFVGEANIIEELTSDDIIVEVNLAEQELTEGQRYYPVKVSAPAKGMVWAYGDHSIIIQVTKLPEEESEAS